MSKQLLFGFKIKLTHKSTIDKEIIFIKLISNIYKFCIFLLIGKKFKDFSVLSVINENQIIKNFSHVQYLREKIFGTIFLPKSFHIPLIGYIII